MLGKDITAMRVRELSEDERMSRIGELEERRDEITARLEAVMWELSRESDTRWLRHSRYGKGDPNRRRERFYKSK